MAFVTRRVIDVFRRIEAEPRVHPSEGIIVSEQEKDSGGPHYGGERGGKSAGNDGGQGGQGEAEGDVGAEQRDEQGNQPGDVGGRGPTERSRRG